MAGLFPLPPVPTSFVEHFLFKQNWNPSSYTRSGSDPSHISMHVLLLLLLLLWWLPLLLLQLRDKFGQWTESRKCARMPGYVSCLSAPPNIGECVWHDSFISECVWHDLFISAWHDSFMTVTWLLHAIVTWLIHVCDMTHSYMCDMTPS